MGDLVKGVLKNSNVPQELNGIVLYNIGVSIDRNNNSYTFFGGCCAEFILIGKRINSSLSLSVYFKEKKVSVELIGSLLIGKQNFSLYSKFLGENSKLCLKAKWESCLFLSEDLNRLAF